MTTMTPSLSTADRETLERESWIDLATIEAFRLYRTTSSEGAALVGRTDREDYAGIVFPIYGPGDDRPKEYILRRDHPPMEEHNGKPKAKGKYLFPPGRGNRLLFGPGESLDVLADTTVPIFIVEGVKKVVAAWRLSRHDAPPQFLAVGVNGVYGWKGTTGKAFDATGARVDVKGPIPDLDRIAWADRSATIIYDSDVRTNPKVRTTRESLIAELRRRGAIVAAPDLPTLDGHDKTGFDDLLAAWGPAQVLDWLTSVQETPLTETDAEVSRLSRLPLLEYGQARKEAAKRLGLPLSILDTVVAKTRKELPHTDDGHGHTITFEEITPAFEAVHGAGLAGRIAALFRRFAALPDHGATALTLWTIFTYCLDLFQIAPRLDLSSPEKQCGKTTVLSLLNRLVFRAALASNITSAAIFRVIAEHRPTLLIDEMDTFIEAAEELRGILNSGHTREAASIIRCEGDDHKPKRFSTWAAMAFAHIGSIPDTLEDRSIRLPMRRKLPSERVNSLRQTGPVAAALHKELNATRREIVRWVQDHSAAIAASSPAPVEGLSDRAVDNWMPLLSIADALGGMWPEQARKAAQALSERSTTDNESIKVELLTDIRDLFAREKTDRLSSSDLCTILALMEERPWGTWKHGKPMTPGQLSRLLKPFGVSSRTVRLEGHGTLKGYLIEDFSDVFARYVSSPGDSALSKRNNVTTRSQSGDNSLFQSVTDDSCYVSENGLNPAPGAGCDVVTVQNSQDDLVEEIDLVD